jgi:hypothetical protein
MKKISHDRLHEILGKAGLELRQRQAVVSALHDYDIVESNHPETVLVEMFGSYDSVADHIAESEYSLYKLISVQCLERGKFLVTFQSSH